MKLFDFDYSLPKELIAQFPLDERDQSQLLVLNREKKNIEHKKFYNILDYLDRGDLLVLNDTKVILARLFGYRKNTGGRIEVLLLDKIESRRFRALIKPLGRLKINEDVAINNNGLSFRLIDFKDRLIEFNKDNILDRLGEIGHVPLPQYIKRIDTLSDRVKYQTVYAKNNGAVAAPTAGLHFTKPLINKIKDKGINIAFLTLHVGYGTFAPVKEENILNHKMHREYFEIPMKTIKLIKRTKDNGGKVVAVGTTTCRALEANRDMILAKDTGISQIKGHTDLFIYPPFRFHVVDSLVTNFHQPKSTLYMLVAAFAGLDNIREAYKQAIDRQYRFFSYGDAMIII